MVGDWLEAAYTDGFIVLHKGDVVYERYFNDQTPATQHLMFSVTKSFTGTMALMLMEQGLIDADALVASYLPELKDTAFGDATVQQMLDMTNSIDYVEDYYQPDAHITGFLNAMMPGGEGLYANLQTLTDKNEKLRSWRRVSLRYAGPGGAWLDHSPSNRRQPRRCPGEDDLDTAWRRA